MSPRRTATTPTRRLADGQVLVRITAAPIVPLDLLCASGTSYFGAPALPYVPGVQGVGVTDDGRRVWVASSAGMAPGDGTLAERYAVTPGDIVPIDGEVDDASVAAIGLSGVAAWSAVHLRARLAAGERVVVLGAGGAVGQVAVAVAVAHGAGRVVGVCRGPAAAERARRNGADEVVTLPEDRDPAALATAITDALGGTADVVIDPVFGWVVEGALRAMTNHGRLVNLGGSAADAATFSSAMVRSKSLSVLGYTNNNLTPEQREEALTSVVALADGRSLVEHAARPLTEVSDAWREVASGSGIRQVLLP